MQLIVLCEVSGSGVLASENKVVSFLRAGRSHALSFFMYFCSALQTALPMAVGGGAKQHSSGLCKLSGGWDGRASWVEVIWCKLRSLTCTD